MHLELAHHKNIILREEPQMAQSGVTQGSYLI
jgi:hypothetical protein